MAFWQPFQEKKLLWVSPPRPGQGFFYRVHIYFQHYRGGTGRGDRKIVQALEGPLRARHDSFLYYTAPSPMRYVELLHGRYQAVRY